MRVLALVTDAFGGYGGIANYNRDLLSALALSTNVSFVLSLPRFGCSDQCTMPAKLHQEPPRPSRIRYVAAAIRAAIFEGPFDIIFCGHLHMVPVAILLSRMLRARLWLQLHGIEAWSVPGNLIRKAAEAANMATAVSRFTRRRFLEWAAIAPEKVHVLPNTIEQRFTPGPKPVDLMRNLNLKERKVILTVSRLAASERYKGHDRVILALPYVLARHRDVVYLIVGEGDDKKRLEDLAGDTGVASSVIFLGRVSNGDLLDYYRLADVFVMPSTGEGFGIVLLEAAACGIHVIAGNRDGSVDPLADGAQGNLIDPENVPALAQAICRILEDMSRPDCKVVSRFRWENFSFYVDQLVENIISTR